MKRKLTQVMTTLLLADFICLAITGLWMRFGQQTEALQQTHAILGMIFILLVFYHWHLFLGMYFRLWKKTRPGGGITRKTAAP